MLNKPAVTLVADANGIFKVCVDVAELNAGEVPAVPTVKVCVPDVMPLIEVIPVAAGLVHAMLVPLEDKTCPLVPTAVNPVPPCPISIVLALHVPEVMVPTVFKFDKDVNVAFAVAVMLPAVVAVVAFPVVF